MSHLRTLLVLIVFLAAMGAGAPLRAEPGAVDDVPGATLLIPYFEIDLDDQAGVTTVVEYRSVSPQAQMTLVTLWTDYGLRLAQFTEYLTGYDVITFNLRDILVNGNLPVTASAGQDPNDILSPQGSFSLDDDVPSCDSIYPYVNPLISDSVLDELQAGFTGQPVFDNVCASFDHGDRVARGYVTIDVIRECGTLGVGDAGFFINGGSGAARNDNALTGTWALFDPERGTVFTHAVALEADGTRPETTAPGNYTFYGRAVGFSAADNREPLAASYAAPAQAAGTELIVWRDSKLPIGGFDCDQPFGPPPPFPLSQEAVIAFDRDENPTELDPGLFPVPFPLATQRVRVGEGDLEAPAKPGWLFLALSTSVGVPVDPGAQAHVTILQFPEQPGAMGTGSTATSLDSASDPLEFSTFPQPRVR